MGADMAIAICAIKVDRHIAEARINTLTSEQIYQCWNYGDGIEPDDTTDYKAKALGYLDWVYGDSRQIAMFVIDGNQYVCSGGMSWGDHPTDAYYPLECVDLLAVCDTQEVWEKTWQNI